MNRSIAVAVSGGVDSMVAAHLLKQETPEVFGIHFRTGFETEPSDRILRRIQSIGEQLSIPVHVIDLSADFKHQVVDAGRHSLEFKGALPVLHGVITGYAEELVTEQGKRSGVV